MKKLFKGIKNKFQRKEINRENLEQICNNPPADLNRFCSVEFANINRRSN